MRRAGLALLFVSLLVSAGAGQEKKGAHSVRVVADRPPPNEVKEAVRKLLSSRCVELVSPGGEKVAEVWLRAEVPVDATEAQFGNGLTYHEVPLSTVLGALRVTGPYTDYRKQAVPAGVYTLRMARQPVTDDHVETAPYRDFVLLVRAEDDVGPELLEQKALWKRSKAINDDHPTALLLFPGKGATMVPALADRGKGHQVLLVRLEARDGARKGPLALGLTLVGGSAKR